MSGLKGGCQYWRLLQRFPPRLCVVIEGRVLASVEVLDAEFQAA